MTDEEISQLLLESEIPVSAVLSNLLDKNTSQRRTNIAAADKTSLSV